MTTANTKQNLFDSPNASNAAALRHAGKRPAFVKPVYDIGTIFRENKDKLKSADNQQRKVFNAISICRTEKLGGHRLHCENCGYEEISYNSCRNRHCPKCQYFKKVKWLNDRADEILPVKYFHIVFTIPDILNPLILQNKIRMYNILFQAASETLNEAAKNPDNLGANIGFIAVLHTWGQNLMDHPHLHCVVTGGGLSKDKTRWIRCRDNFFIAVKKLRKLFRGKFLAYLKEAYDNEEIQFHGKLKQNQVKHHFMDLHKKCYAKTWMVYAKKPFDSPVGVFKYLGRYTHRVAISNSRITGYTGDEVSFRWKD